jgi:nicotinamide riboside transporter PnuC
VSSDLPFPGNPLGRSCDRTKQGSRARGARLELGLQVIGVITGYVGAEMNASMRIEGFFLWLASNVALGVLHVFRGLWLLLVLDALFVRVNLVGIRHWSRERPKPFPRWTRTLLRQS